MMVDTCWGQLLVVEPAARRRSRGKAYPFALIRVASIREHLIETYLIG